MRIGIDAMVLGNRDTGVEVWIRGLLRALGRHPADNRYVVYMPQGISAGEVDARRGKLQIQRVALPGGSRLARIAWEELVLPSRTERDGLDLLHCPAYVAPHHVTVPTVVTLHDLFVYTHPECCRRRNRLHFRLRLPPSIRHASRIHCTSSWTRECLRSRFPSAQGKDPVVHPAVDDVFQPLSESRIEKYRREQNLPENPYIFVGNPEPKKNLAYLIEGFTRLLERDEGQYLMLVGGEGWDQAGMKRLMDTPGVRDHVIRTGYVGRDELPMLYGMSRALVFPSVIEGFGLPPLEAMACGTPVITTAAGGLPESVGDAAVIVDGATPEELADAMWQLMTDSQKRKELEEAGLRRAEQFRWDDLIDDMLQIYEEAGRDPHGSVFPTMSTQILLNQARG